MKVRQEQILQKIWIIKLLQNVFLALLLSVICIKSGDSALQAIQHLFQDHWIVDSGPIYYKTPNPKCRLYCCLIEFIDQRYSQSCWYFRPVFFNFCPSSLLWLSLPPPPFHVRISILYYTCIQFLTGRGVGVIGRDGGLRQIKHLPQSPLTGQFFQITTFGIAFYQSNLSTIVSILDLRTSRILMGKRCNW